MQVKRRQFLQMAGLIPALTLARPRQVLGAVAGRTRWRMGVQWTADMPLLTRGAFAFAREVALVSESRLAIDVNVAGEGAPPGGILAQVAAGELDCGHVLFSHQQGTGAALEVFASVPFGLDAAGMNAWLYHGGGLPLLREAALERGFFALPMGDTGGGPFAWTRGVDVAADGVSGLRLPARGLGARVLAAAGAQVPEGLPATGAAMKAAFASQHLDGAWWHGLACEMALGLDAAADAVLLPGWLRPSERLVLILNKAAYEALPAVVRHMLDVCAAQADLRIQAACRHAAAAGWADLLRRRPDMPRYFPARQLRRLHDAADDVLQTVAAGDGLASKVLGQYRAALPRAGRGGRWPGNGGTRGTA